MDIETVAEYVEDKETYDALVKIGIDFLQGYYIDRPPLLLEKGLDTAIAPVKNKTAKGGQ